METSREGESAPGFAKRAPNFGKVVARAEDYSAQPLSRDEVNRAVLFGMPHLAAAETKLLLVYLAFLSREDLQSDRAFVYPSNRLVCAITDWGPSTLRRHRQALEHKGLIIRNLNRANRPAHTEAVDLRPVLSAVRLAQEAADKVFDAHRDYLALVTGSDVYEHQSSAREPGTEHLIQSQPYHSESVTDSAPPAPSRSPRSAAKRPISTPSTETAAIKKPTRPTDRATKERLETRRVSDTEFKPRSTVSDTKARAQIAEAVQLAPSLEPYFREVDFNTASLSPLVALAGEAVSGLFPERNTAGHTWNWAVKRHGWRAVLGLVAALADPTVRDRYGFLGWISKTSGIDFTTNLRRAASDQAPEAPQAAPQVEEAGDPPEQVVQLDDTWSKILRRMPTRLGKVAVEGWLENLTYHGVEAKTLHLTAPTRFVRDYVLRTYADDIAKAARAEGLVVAEVEITVATS